MGKDNTGLGLCVVVVGDPRQEFVPTVVHWAREREIDVLSCENVYAAVVAVAQAAGRRVLVVGQMWELASENGSFLRIAATRGIRCCCLLDPDGPRREVVRTGAQDLLAAARAGVTIVGDVREVRGALTEWLATAESLEVPVAGREPSRPTRRARDAAEEAYEDLRATEAELSALLG